MCLVLFLGMVLLTIGFPSRTLRELCTGLIEEKYVLVLASKLQSD